MGTPDTNESPNSHGNSDAVEDTSKSVLDSLPHWLKPGVARETHLLLQVLLVSLNAFLLYCAVTGVFRPHFEIMFVISLGLTVCYYIFMNEIAKLYVEETEKKRKLRRKADKREKEGTKGE